MRAAGKRGLSPFGGMSAEGEGASAGLRRGAAAGWYSTDDYIPYSHRYAHFGPAPLTFTHSLNADAS